MIRLEDTTGNKVQAAITAERHRLGSPATGMVLTLLVLTDEAGQSDAASAAAFAAQEHPMRILILIPRKARSVPRLDAEISVGGDDGPGEFAVLRLRGELANHAGSVAIPLLLTDTPVVAWWPGDAPAVPAEDPIGIHAQRRITDASSASRQLQALQDRMNGYRPGDTDLTWTMVTHWRTLLATALDQPHGRVIGAEVSVQKSRVSGHILAAWLHQRLEVPANVIASKGPGLTGVRLLTTEGEISISRPDGQVAKLTRTGLPPATISLPRREPGDLLAEELRRLDPDEVYGEALQALEEVGTGRLHLDTQPTRARRRGAEGPKAGRE
jgi:glucose-6-phosphate dehydrogenase assembly protein OpcA